jgi:NAD(P)H-dependent FMN reductase
LTKSLLFVHHTVSPATHAMYLAALQGARDPSISNVVVETRAALSASVADALEADGYLLGSPVNLGYMSGGLKYFLDEVYYPCLESTRGRPFAVYLHGDNDATGALRALESITTGLGWRVAQKAVVVTGPPSRDDLEALRELGASLAAGLSLDS